MLNFYHYIEVVTAWELMLYFIAVVAAFLIFDLLSLFYKFAGCLLLSNNFWVSD